MAIYTTIDDLTKRLEPAVLAGLADDQNTPPDLEHPDTQDVIGRAIADGANLIDSYLLGRVDLSSVPTQAALERINATLALYFLYRRRYVDDALNPLAASREAPRAAARIALLASVTIGFVSAQLPPGGTSSRLSAPRNTSGSRSFARPLALARSSTWRISR